jgi:hypothetical protein
MLFGLSHKGMKMGRTFGTNGGKKHMEFWWASLKKKDDIYKNEW